MSRLLCCLRGRRRDMGAALSHPQEGEASEVVAPPTMADVIRERKKKAGGASLGTLRRRIANAARRPRDNRPDRGCEHARFIRSVVSSWRLAEVFVLCEELEAGSALRDLSTQADLAREPAPALHTQLPIARQERWWCDVELVGGSGAGSWSTHAHRAILAARSAYFRDLFHRYPPTQFVSCVRIPLEGVCSTMTLAECEACLHALYSGQPLTARATTQGNHSNHATHKYDNENQEAELDILNGDSNSRNNTCTCTYVIPPRIATAIDATTCSVQTSMHYLLDSGEMADTRLVFRLENGCGSAYGFRTALELPCHRVVLAARSRFFKSIMSRRGASSSSGAVCVDEKVLPRRYARALLHAAYTDQIDLSLIGRNTSSPPSTNGSTSAWTGVGRSSASTSRPTNCAMLDDAFQLYEIARFLEMPIVVQGCEDAIVESLSPETLHHVLRWAAAPHASQWVLRQAMRYLLDEFTQIMSHSNACRIPRAALTQALASDHLQASEQQILRAIVKWSADQPPPREPNVVWHTAHSVSRRGARRRSNSDAALRETLASLVPLVRTEHLPADCMTLHQLVRRGIIPSPPPPAEEGSTAHAWLGRGSYRPARCFLPYLDEIKALLEDQAVPEAELARARRARYLHRIPDTLYMVAAARNPESVCSSPGGAPTDGSALCLSPATLGLVRTRARHLRQLTAHHAQTLAHHHTTNTQIALRAVREMGLPDSCADIILHEDNETENDNDRDSEQNTSDWEAGTAHARPASREWEPEEPCCRSAESGAGRCASAGSLRAWQSAHHAPADISRSGTCERRHRTEAPLARRSGGSFSGAGGSRARLSAAVPDVAMAPNANTHLLTHRDYFTHPPPWEYGGVVLQLDLGDGALHTPRPGSRAQRNSLAHTNRDRPVRDQAMSCLRARSDEEELRAAIELSVMRAYSSFHGRGSPPPSAAPAPRRAAATLPQHFRNELPQPGGSNNAAAAARQLELPQPTAPAAPALQALVSAPRASPSPRRRDFSLYRHQHDYRLEPQYGGSASTSRGHSPNNYA